MSASSSASSDTPPPEAYDPDRVAECLEGAAQQFRRARPIAQEQDLGALAQVLREMRQEMQGMHREMQGMRQEMQGMNQRLDALDVRVDAINIRVDAIDVRLFNNEARAKNRYALINGADYVPLLKADGTAIPNFPRNAEAVEALTSRAIDSLLTDLDVDFEGRNLGKKKVLFFREIGVKVTHTA